MPRTVTFATAVVLTLWCAARALVIDALAGPLERVEFEGASQPLLRGTVMPGDRIQGYLAKPEGAGPFPAVIALHGCGGMPDMTKRKLVDELVGWGYVVLLVDPAICTLGRRLDPRHRSRSLHVRHPFAAPDQGHVDLPTHGESSRGPAIIGPFQDRKHGALPRHRGRRRSGDRRASRRVTRPGRTGLLCPADREAPKTLNSDGGQRKDLRLQSGCIPDHART